MIGLVVNVADQPLGSALAVDAPTGTTVLEVFDVGDYRGGTVQVGAAEYTYDAIDPDVNTVTLSSGLTADAFAGDLVNVWDATTSATAVQRRVFVEVPGDVANGEPINAVLQHQLVPFLPEGLRAPGAGEQAELTDRGGGRWVVTDLPNRFPQFDGAHIAPATVPEEALGFTLPGGTQVTVAAVAPATPADGDLWIDTSNDDLMSRWDAGTAAWVPVQFGVGAVSFTARDIGGVTTTIDAVAPASPLEGDLWYDTANDYQLNRWDGTAWVPVQFGVGAVSFTARDIGGVATTFAAAAPAAPLTGDLWYDTAHDYQLNRWDGTAWVAVQFGTDAIAAGSITQAEVSFTARDIGGITTTIAAAAPAGAKAGDLWYDSANGYKLNHYDGTTWSAFQYGTNAIAAGSVTAALIAAHTITATQIAAGAITASELAANSVTATQIAANAVTATKIAANTITAAQIAANTITAAQIAGNTITAGQIAAGTITTTQIAAGTILAANIAANTITAAKIAAGTITATELAANSVTATQIAASAVTAAKIAAGTIIAGIVDGTTISGAQIVAHGSSGEILVYDGTPAAGNLIFAASGAAGTDAFGNHFSAGLSIGGNAPSETLTFMDNDGTVQGYIGKQSLSSAGIKVIAGTTGHECGVLLNPTGFVSLDNGLLISPSGITMQFESASSGLGVGSNGPIGKYYQQKVRPSTSQNIAASTNVILTGFTNVKTRSDYGSQWNLSTGTWTCPADGPYRFSFLASFASWTGGSRLRLTAIKNGTTQIGDIDLSQAGGNGRLQLMFEDDLASGDTVQFQVFHVSGATRQLDANSYIHIARTL